MKTSVIVTPEACQYTREHSVRETDVQAELRAETEKVIGERSLMLSAPEEMQLLQLMLKMLHAKKTLDIGVFTGYSSLCQALALPDDGKVYALDVSEEYTSVGKPFWARAGVQHKIELKIAPALESLDELINGNDGEHKGTFDFAYIDADKNNYAAYVDRAHTLLRKGGLIAIDNVLWGGQVYTKSQQEAENEGDINTLALKKLNSDLKSDERFEIAMATISDGVTFLLKR